MRAPKPNRPRSFTLIETVVAMGIMAIVMMAMLASEFSGSQLRTNTRQMEFLQGEVQLYFGALRRMNSSPEVVARLTPDWIATGLKTSREETALGGDIDNGVFIVSSTAVVLTEADTAATFGGTFDLNRDGTPNDPTPDPDPGANYATVVPVRVTITWRNLLAGDGTATRTLTYETIIYPRGNLQ